MPYPCRPSLTRRALLLAACASALAGCLQEAQAGRPLVNLSIVDRDSGQVLQVYQHEGRMFVAGRPGARYSLRVQNRTPGRVMAVLSVDGINIVSGQTADYNQVGYVLDAWRSYDIAGWRKSDTEIAAFEFATLTESYAAKTGRPGNVGVIGVAVFEEKKRTPPVAMPYPSPQVLGRTEDGRTNGASRQEADGSNATAAESAPPAAAPGATADAGAARMRERPDSPAAALQKDKLGTGHGQREWSVASRTEFERATSYPASVRLIEYDSYRNLVARGVIASDWAEGRRPNPFPSRPIAPGYVPDPPQ